MSDDDDNLLELGPHSFMTVNEVMAYATRRCAAGGITDVMVIGFNGDELVALSSNMPQKDALWCLEWAKQYTMGLVKE